MDLLKEGNCKMWEWKSAIDKYKWLKIIICCSFCFFVFIVVEFFDNADMHCITGAFLILLFFKLDHIFEYIERRVDEIMKPKKRTNPKQSDQSDYYIY